MKKNFTVNISGIIFHIDEDAYEQLRTYLDSIRKHFAGEPSQDEICNDIESRVAEMLQGRLNDSKNVITIADVSEIIGEMGQPFEFDEQEEQAIPGKEAPGRKGSKRLYRDPDDKILGGVAAGMGAYFHTDPLWFRLGFIISFFFSGPLLYLLFWLVIPAARTTAEKLEMRGEHVNVATIERSIREELNHIADRLKDLKNEGSGYKKKAGDNVRTGFEKLVDAVIIVTRYVVKAFIILMGIAFILISVSLAIPFITSIINPGGMVIAFGIESHLLSLPDLLDFLFVDSRDQLMTIAGLSFMIGVPLLMLIYHGVKMIFGIRFHSRVIGGTAFGVWIIGIILCGVAATSLVTEFRAEGRLRETIELNHPMDSTYHLTLDRDMMDQATHYGHVYFDTEDPDGPLFQYPQLSVRKSNDDQARLVSYIYSRGPSPMAARVSGESLVYPLRVEDSLIILPPYFHLDEGAKWRAQNLKLVIEIPEGSLISASKDIEHLTGLSDNWLNFPSDFAGNAWRMTQYDGLVNVTAVNTP